MGLSVDSGEWAGMTLRFQYPGQSERVADESTPFRELSAGDVVVVDVGERDGSNSRRRVSRFNRTAYRVEHADGFRNICRLIPSDGRAAELTAKRGEWIRGSLSVELWAVGRVSADARAYRVLETDGCGDE